MDVPQHQDWIVTLRAIACVMVIVLHVAAIGVLESPVTSVDWWLANLADSAVRGCVPLFFMISGYLFMADRAPAPRHFIRIAAALLFYSALAALYLWAASGSFPAGRVVRMAWHPVFYHLWFFYTLFTVYLMACLVRIRPMPGRAAVAVLAVILLGLNGLGPLPDSSPLTISGNGIVFFLYAVSGAVIGQTLPRLSPSQGGLIRRACPLVFVGAVAATAALTLSASSANGAFVATFLCLRASAGGPCGVVGLCLGGPGPATQGPPLSLSTGRAIAADLWRARAVAGTGNNDLEACGGVVPDVRAPVPGQDGRVVLADGGDPVQAGPEPLDHLTTAPGPVKRVS